MQIFGNYENSREQLERAVTAIKPKEQLQCESNKGNEQ